MPEKDRIIQVGVAGFGMSAQLFHTPFISSNPHFRLRKILERNAGRAKEAYPGTESVREFEDLLGADIDLVVICTPNPLHFPMAKEAILAGKNVVVEKPVTATAEEAQELLALAKKKGVFYSPFQNRRFDGDYLTVQRLAADGILGEILEYYARYDRFVSGGSNRAWKAKGGRGVNILYDLGVHLIDQAYCLFGMPDEIYADFRKERAESTGFDAFEVILYYEKTKAVLSASEVALNPAPHYVVYGRNGSFVKYGMDPQEEALMRWERPGSADWGSDRPEQYGTLSRVEDGLVKTEKIETEQGNYGRFYDNVYEVLCCGVRQLIDPTDAVNVLKIIETASLSAATGKREKP
ncbi:MAG: Gfo/Idh/MocA family oxidoreductase [Oscillospiraceae bacterium]|nr:Gfo/Idh/MocA family oxidoreductase [Oscillospiraceae bacterium]